MDAKREEKLIYREFGETDLAAGLSLSQSLGWSHIDVDWSFMAALGDGIAVEQDGRLVGVGFLWTFGSVCTLGMMLVASDMQRRGIGAALMNKLLAKAGDKTITLIATEQGRPLYEKLGFETVDYNWLHMGDAKRALVSESPDVAAGSAARFDAVAEMDIQVSGWPRLAMLEQLESMGQRADLVRDGRLVGYAYLRRSGLGHTIGPVIANDDDDARQLISYCAQLVEGILRMDVAVESLPLAEWLTYIGMPLTSKSVKMRRGEPGPPSIGKARMFVITNQALL